MGHPFGAPATVQVHVKNGWLPRATHGWRVHSLGIFTSTDKDYRMAVLSQDNATEEYGIDTIQALASVVHRDLNGGAGSHTAEAAPTAAETPQHPKSPTAPHRSDRSRPDARSEPPPPRVRGARGGAGHGSGRPAGPPVGAIPRRIRQSPSAAWYLGAGSVDGLLHLGHAQGQQDEGPSLAVRSDGHQARGPHGSARSPPDGRAEPLAGAAITRTAAIRRGRGRVLSGWEPRAAGPPLRLRRLRGGRPRGTRAGRATPRPRERQVGCRARRATGLRGASRRRGWRTARG